MSQSPFGTSCQRCWWVWDTRLRAFTSLTDWFTDWLCSSGCWPCSCGLSSPSNPHSRPWEWPWPEPTTTTAANGPKSTWATNRWSAWRRGSPAQFRATPTSNTELDYWTTKKNCSYTTPVRKTWPGFAECTNRCYFPFPPADGSK